MHENSLSFANRDYTFHNIANHYLRQRFKRNSTVIHRDLAVRQHFRFASLRSMMDRVDDPSVSLRLLVVDFLFLYVLRRRSLSTVSNDDCLIGIISGKVYEQPTQEARSRSFTFAQQLIARDLYRSLLSWYFNMKNVFRTIYKLDKILYPRMLFHVWCNIYKGGEKQSQRLISKCCSPMTKLLEKLILKPPPFYTLFFLLERITRLIKYKSLIQRFTTEDSILRYTYINNH